MSANDKTESNESADNGAGAATPAPESTPRGGGLASELIAGMSEPSEHAIAQAQAQQAENVNSLPDGFDPALHETDANGKPVLTPTGRFKKKPKGAAGSTAKKSVLSTGRAESVQVPTASPEQIARASGAGAANLLIVMGMIVGGEEWQPRQNKDMDEKAMLEQAFGDYFAATGKMDIPPGWALCAAIGLYAAPRFTMPKTQSRFKRLKMWIASKWIARQMRKRGKTDDEITKAIAAQYQAQ